MKTVTCIDPPLVISPTEIQLKSILNLPQFLFRVLNEDDDEDEIFEEQGHALSIDARLPATLEKKSKDDDDEVEVDCLKWWILLRPKYPIVFKLVRAALSIFQGPHAESTFNVMGDLIEKHSG